VSFGHRLASIRQIRGLSQSDLAKRTGLKPSAVSHFETGRRLPAIHNLKVLCDALDISADYLIGRLK
jgi:transcriptional regulator with XRE-family HTH domain